MGQTNGNLKAELISQHKNVKCLPWRPYQPFPDNLHPTGSRGLVLQMKIMESLPAPREAVSADAFWWVDAQFLPYNDAQLVVSTTPYTPRQFHPWVPFKTFPNGRIVLYNARHHPVKGRVLIGTESPMYPKVQPHPTGEAVVYAGKGEVRVDTLTSEPLYSKSRELDNRSHRFCAVSPNGVNIAVLTHCQRSFYLEILQMAMSLTCHRRPVPCHRLCPGFEASGAHNDHVECKWSPDGSHLGVSSSGGQLFLVDCRLSQDSAVDVMSCLGDDQTLSTAASFDFDPTVGYSILAVGTSDGSLTICQINVSETEGTMGDREITPLLKMDHGEAITCVQYNQDGSSVAVAFRVFRVMIYSSEDLSFQHDIDWSSCCPRHVSLYQNLSYPTVQRLSFSYDGRYLATSSCDGCVRVWSVPRLLTLQEWCRKGILHTMPVALIRTSRLPAKLKRFLLSEYF